MPTIYLVYPLAGSSMNDPTQIQKQFLEQVKENAKSDFHLVDLLSDYLNISKDSAYRRIRGDTLLTIEEIRRLSSALGISLDSLINVNPDTVTFNKRSLLDPDFKFEDYLKSILENLKMVSSFKIKELIYAAKDITLFNYFHFNELTCFKVYFWCHIIIKDPRFDIEPFSFDIVPDEILALGNSIFETQLGIPSTEIWSEETANVTLRQIEYLYETGVLSQQDAITILNQVTDLLKHVNDQAVYGKKFFPGKPESGIDNTMKFYFNEIAISDNTVFFEMDQTMITFITYNMLSLLNTSDEKFCAQTKQYLDNLISKSELISVISEKQRIKFFNRMYHKTDALLEKITRNS